MGSHQWTRIAIASRLHRSDVFVEVSVHLLDIYRPQVRIGRRMSVLTVRAVAQVSNTCITMANTYVDIKNVQSG